MRKLALSLLLLAAPAFSQTLCTLHADVNVTPAIGNALIVPIPSDLGRNLTICGVYISVTQAATPANFQLRGCSDATCSNTQVLTPLYTGHASYLDTYNSAPANVFQPVLRGNGIYLYLSAVPTAAQVQVFYTVP